VQTPVASRREFLGASSLALLGAAVQAVERDYALSSEARSAKEEQSPEPIIDIHQHLGWQFENASRIFRL